VVREALSESRVVAIRGPRQAGKSTLARQLISHGWKAAYLTLDDEPTLAAARGDPIGFVADIKGPAVIDEIQRAPDLMLAIKKRVDIDQTRGQFLITGSANLVTLKTVQDALPGRVDYLNLFTLSQAEIEQLPNPGLIDALHEGRVPSLSGIPVGARMYAERFVAGGYPDAFRRTEASRLRFFRSYVQSVIERELPDIIDLRRPDIPPLLLNLVASRSAGILNVASMARDLRVDENTVLSHLKLLEDLMLVRRNAPWYRNLSQRQIKAPKIYLTDPGLFAALIGASAERAMSDPTIKGMLFETAVITELIKLAASSLLPPELFHYRDAKQREIDLVLEWPDGSVVAVEVKASSSVASEDLRSLRYLRERVGDAFKAGLILNCGEHTLPFGDRIHAVPIQVLWSP
jgi:predicted AAA+ superfamily ATPase